ncbi:hypothetical protein V1477_001122, partial [Vespula maculifrons]
LYNPRISWKDLSIEFICKKYRRSVLSQREILQHGIRGYTVPFPFLVSNQLLPFDAIDTLFLTNNNNSSNSNGKCKEGDGFSSSFRLSRSNHVDLTRYKLSEERSFEVNERINVHLKRSLLKQSFMINDGKILQVFTPLEISIITGVTYSSGSIKMLNAGEDRA